MKYFIMSDIHGHYKEMMEALSKTDFDMNNEKHKLIINGDMFDRGNQSKEVFEFLYPLSLDGKAIILKGNHEFFLEEFLEGNKERVEFNCTYNGFKKTLLSFIPNYDKISFENASRILHKQYPYLKKWLSNLPYYFETKQYVITHAGLDFSHGDYRLGNFKRAVWTKPEEFFEIDLEKEFNFKKIVVVGHRFTSKIRSYFNLIDEDKHSIYYHKDKQKIGIDGGCYHSKRINVFEIIEN
ncbi:serine/threonine protein phosphatase [Mycoplasmatota bacterium]|nr:serine/threonine protein phosphatase [Mycoplasmatota bacterium]